MPTMKVSTLLVILSLNRLVLSHSNEPKPMMNKSSLQERHHVAEHMGDLFGGESGIEQMAEEELKFLYFKMHDSDDNNMLDGCELVKSLLHWHVEEHKAMGGVPSDHDHGTTRIFVHEELALMIDPILHSDDRNMDGFIDYSEFVAAQKSRGF